MDQQRIAQIAQKYFEENELTEWTSSDLGRLQVGLHNAIVSEYPDLDPSLRFTITFMSLGRADGSREVHVDITQTVGKIELRIPR
jgi:hypothetical protein